MAIHMDGGRLTPAGLRAGKVELRKNGENYVQLSMSRGIYYVTAQNEGHIVRLEYTFLKDARRKFDQWVV